jgi:hypothetical protein
VSAGWPARSRSPACASTTGPIACILRRRPVCSPTFAGCSVTTCRPVAATAACGSPAGGSASRCVRASSPASCRRRWSPGSPETRRHHRCGRRAPTPTRACCARASGRRSTTSCTGPTRRSCGDFPAIASAASRPGAASRPTPRGRSPGGWSAAAGATGRGRPTSTPGADSARSSKRWARRPRRQVPRSGWRRRSTACGWSRTRWSSAPRTPTSSSRGTSSPPCRCRSSPGSAGRRRRWPTSSRPAGCGSARCCWSTWSTGAAGGPRSTRITCRVWRRRSRASPSRPTTATAPTTRPTGRSCARRSRAR